MPDERIIKEARAGRFQLTLWKSRVLGKKPKMCLQFGNQDKDKVWVNTRTWFFENQLADLREVIKRYDALVEASNESP